MTQNLKDRIKEIETQRDTMNDELRDLRRRERWQESHAAEVDAAVLAEVVKQNPNMAEWVNGLRSETSDRMYAAYVDECDAKRAKGTDAAASNGGGQA
ncbi:MAG: hypothetical protein E6165_01530 [Varibaculum cambriense]|nr:hypothetical protein [Varibaculum cambriense]MDU5614882.1 hypothetical protein [Varibaculum cambriense]